MHAALCKSIMFSRFFRCLTTEDAKIFQLSPSNTWFLLFFMCSFVVFCCPALTLMKLRGFVSGKTFQCSGGSRRTYLANNARISRPRIASGSGTCGSQCAENISKDFNTCFWRELITETKKRHRLRARLTRKRVRHREINFPRFPAYLSRLKC